jgi:hypothetical protein
MNMNAGIYGSALQQFQDHFGVSAQVARLGQGLFLICYAFGTMGAVLRGVRSKLLLSKA